MREHPSYQAISAARRRRDKDRRGTRVRCEAKQLDGTRCPTNGLPTHGRVLCWTHTKAHEAGRLLELVDAGGMLRVALDPTSVRL